MCDINRNTKNIFAIVASLAAFIGAVGGLASFIPYIQNQITIIFGISPQEIRALLTFVFIIALGFLIAIFTFYSTNSGEKLNSEEEPNTEEKPNSEEKFEIKIFCRKNKIEDLPFGNPAFKAYIKVALPFLNITQEAFFDQAIKKLYYSIDNNKFRGELDWERENTISLTEKNNTVIQLEIEYKLSKDVRALGSTWGPLHGESDRARSTQYRIGGDARQRILLKSDNRILEYIYEAPKISLWDKGQIYSKN